MRFFDNVLIRLKEINCFSESIAACLMFHRVDHIPSDSIGMIPAITLPPDTFEAIIQHISRVFQPVHLDDVVSALSGRNKLPENAITVTFDDGYLDNYTAAYPILKRYRVPATIYITTGFITGDTSPYEARLGAWIQQVDELQFSWQGTDHHYDLRTRSQKEKTYRAIKKITKPMSDSRRRHLLNQFIPSEWQPDSPAPMTWQHIQELDADPLITIGAHTHTHPVLTAISHADAQRDIVTSQQYLEVHLKHAVRHFSYPYGSHNYSVRRLVHSAGFLSAVTTQPRCVQSGGREQFRLPRYDSHVYSVTKTSSISDI